jgi:hypothetical protein
MDLPLTYTLDPDAPRGDVIPALAGWLRDRVRRRREEVRRQEAEERDERDAVESTLP